MRRLFPCAAVLSILLLGPSAGAQTPSSQAGTGSIVGAESVSENRPKARKLYARGKHLFRQHRYSQALDVFQEAYRYWHRREINLSIAYTYARMGNAIKAVTALRQYLAKATDSEKKRLPSRLKQVQGEVGVLVVTVPDAQADIMVNGRSVGHSHIELVVEPGKVAVEIRLGGKTVAHKVVECLAGTVKVWELAEMPRSPGPRHPRVVHVANGSGMGANQGHGGTGPVAPPSKPGLGRLHWAYFVGAAALAVVAGAAAGGLGAATAKTHDDYKAHPSESLMKKGNAYKLGTNILIGVAAGGAAAAVVLAIFTKWHHKERQSRRVTIIPMPTVGGFGLTLEYRR